MKFKQGTIFMKLQGDCPRILFFLILCCSMAVHAQEVSKVTGTVVDAEDGVPIPGVSIVKKGTNIGVSTDFDGNYSIAAKQGDILEFSYIGMEFQAITVSEPVLNVRMKADVENLEEVVVIGYGAVKKKELTGAVASVKGDDLENIVTQDLGTALQGQVSGVNIVSSGQPGAASEILIRGITSISGSNTPLYVVDGIPQEGDPRIAPSDIESIDILKDASSAAIYGTRGASGVILITTKQGKQGALSVRVDASYGFQKVPSGIDLMNTEEQTYFNLVSERNETGSTDDVTVLTLARSPQGFQNNTDIRDIIIRENTPFKNYSVNVSGGGNDIKYNVSTSLYDTEGVIINSDFKRFNTRVNTTYTRGKWGINASVGMSREDRSREPGGIINQVIRYLPTQQGLEAIGSDEPLVEVRSTESNRLGWVLNSLSSTDIERTVRTFASFNVNYEIVKGLNVWSRIGVNESNGYRDRFLGYTPVFTAEGELINNPSDSFAESRANQRSSNVWETVLTYKNQLSEDHNLTLTAGYTQEEYSGKDFSAKKFGVQNNDIRVLDNATINPDAQSGFYYNSTILGMLGRLQYNYKGKYFLSSSVRRDGSSKFGESRRWGLFPSVSVSWNVSDEGFWKPLKNVVNNFKLRANRGSLGNNRFGDYAFSAAIASGIDYSFGTGDGVLNIGSAQSEFANALVKWETKKEVNFGADFGLFKNKITLSADIYNIKNEDMLFPIVLPGSAGGGGNSQIVLNVGNMTNKGAELAIGYREKIGRFNFNMNGTFTTNENKITKISGDKGFIFTNDYGLVSGARVESQVTVLAEGYEAGAFFLRKTNGIADTPEKLAEYQEIDPAAKMGDVVYIDSNGDGSISDADRVYSGSGLPEYEIGYNFNANYKGVDFSMQWYAALGHEIMNGSKATAYAYGRHKDLIYAWSESNTSTPIPAFRGDIKAHPNFRGYNDLWLEDGDYVRLKNVTLGYSFPRKLVEKAGLSKFRIYATAQNLLTITDYEGYNPEIGGGISARGLDKGNYPITSQYLFGLEFNF
ncbi:TonB-linked outer membrane protein, SusC/RagA family [Zobellia uliginosa]|uniref:TonB-linked outer membrane protein, SusC/RagA family n=1 Tax=Zobellia uliginosa TaxID=143224 RepID=A0ABY1L5E8_9FLAO|nr:TonB-dependent receptor [Zobellia uliginosa]SIT11525.1 TonB-linked outer membrane protein, SusC/RagA family [Zobellia uliginosa]